MAPPPTPAADRPEPGDGARSPGGAGLIALVLITGVAAVLRLSSLRGVAPDPFYDAAVRSMSQSLHNFFFGAYEPGGSVSIDKPPIDLWLQVAAVKLFGFGPVALRLPQALAGTLAVPVLYDAVRRVFGTTAGLASGLVLAVMPIAVLTARSDTMDAVMMLLTVLAFWLLVRFAADPRPRWLYLAAGAMGLAFNVKLFQGLVGLPALALLAWLASGEGRVRRLLLAGGVFVAVGLSWLATTLIVPNAPYAIGSTNGSAWNAAFVFNGYDRIAGPATQSSLNGPDPTGSGKPAGNTEQQRAAVPIGTPSAVRLFDHDGPLSGLRFGFVLLAALGLGVPALIASLRVADQRAAAAAVLVWLGTGVVLFSAMARLHPRYTDGFTPAVAAAAGIGLAWVARGASRSTRTGLATRALGGATAVGLVLYGRFLLGDASGIWRFTALAGAAAIVAAVIPLPASRAGLARLRGPALGGSLVVAADPDSRPGRPRTGDPPRGRRGSRRGDGPQPDSVAERLSPDQSARRALRAGDGLGDPGGRADRPGRPAGPRADLLRRPPADRRQPARRAGGRRGRPLRPARWRVRSANVEDARPMLEWRVLGSGPRA